MVYEPRGSGNHHMGLDERKFPEQISGLLSNKRKEGRIVQNGSERGRESGGLCRETAI